MSVLGVATGARLSNPKLLEPALDQMAEFGVQAIRTSAQWDRVEPTLGGGRDWSGPEAIVAGAEKRGIQVVLEGASRSTDLYDPTIAKAYPGYMAELAQRFGDRIIATATYNEVNNASYAEVISGRQFARLVQIPAYTAIKEVAPSLTVLTTGFAAGNKGHADLFLADMYAAGVKDHFDALAFHPYSHPLSFKEAMARKTDGPWLLHLCRQIMRENGDSAKQVWCTEYGSNTGGARSKVTPEVQAQHLAEWVAWCRNHPWVGPCFWFTWADNPNNDPLNYGDTMGLVDVAGNPKPALHTFAALTTGGN